MFTNEMSWADWQYAASVKATALRKLLQDGLVLQQKFYKLTYGLTDPQILALPFMTGKTQDYLDALRTSLNTIKDMHDVFFGIAALAQYDRNAAMTALME